MRRHFSKVAAFSLVEVTLALAVAAFGLIAIFGLLPTGLNSNQASIRQTAAADIIAGIVADLRQAPTANVIASAAGATPSSIIQPVSPRLMIDLTQSNTKGYLDESGNLSSGTSLASSSLNSNSYYQVNITVLNPVQSPPPSPATRTVTMATIQVSWPAQAQTPSATDTLSVFVSLDRN